MAWSLTLATFSFENIVGCLKKTGVANPLSAVNLVARLSVFFYLIVICAAVVSRAPARSKAAGAEGRISATIGTFILTTLFLFPRHDLSLAAAAVSALLVSGGNMLAIAALVQIRNSFSIMPEVRQLVTSGLYK